jgi:benzoate-CoA ligase family protein
MHYLAYSTMDRENHTTPLGDRLEVPHGFNAAAYFVDRHLEEGRGQKVALIDDSGSHTYSELSSLVNRAAAALIGRGVRAGERVILCLLDTIAFPAMFYGALKIGAVPIPINTYLAADDYDFIPRDSGAVVLALSASTAPIWAETVRRESALRTLIVADGVAPLFASEATSFKEFIAEGTDTIAPVAIPRDEIGFWLYSSGSTGRPKGVLHRHVDLFHTAVLYGERVLGIRESDLVFSASKMFFAYGLGNSCTFPLHAGATAVLMAARPAPEAVARVMRAHQPSAFFGVPTLYASLLESIVGDERPLSKRLRLCASAGEALPPAVAEHWASQVGVEILDGLGSTESMHIFLTNRPGEIRRASSGREVPGYEISIRDEHGEEAAVDQIGDLWMRGASIAAGYWNNPEATARTFVGGWLRTGDKYLRDAEGFYHYAGRSDDMLKVGGIWVSPIEVEAALLEHPQVLDVAVIGVADEDSLIKPKAYVVLRDQSHAGDVFARELQQFIRSRLAHYKYPRWIEFRTELPRTATGKLRRNALRSDQ